MPRTTLDTTYTRPTLNKPQRKDYHYRHILIEPRFQQESQYPTRPGSNFLPEHFNPASVFRQEFHAGNRSLESSRHLETVGMNVLISSEKSDTEQKSKPQPQNVPPTSKPFAPPIDMSESIRHPNAFPTPKLSKESDKYQD